MEAIYQDLRFALRGLRRSPGFALVAVLTLALGIGANTAIFSVVNGVVLRPLPFPEPDRLTHLGWSWGEGPMPSLTELKFDYFREHNRTLEGVASWSGFTAEGPAGFPDEGVRGLNVTEDFFRVIGLQPALGRGFTEEEYRTPNSRVAVIGHELWRNQLGGDPGVLGRELELNGRVHTIVGVMPAAYRLPQASEYTSVLRPRAVRPDPEDLGHNTTAMARIRPGVTPQQVQADLERVLASFREEYPRHAGGAHESIGLLSFEEIYVGPIRGMLWMLLGAIGFVLLIACANVANLLLARATERQREMAVRVALGAGRGRILRQLLTESVVIALVAGVLGAGLAWWGVDALLQLSPTPLPRQDEIGLDGRVLGFTLLLATLTGILFGMAAGVPASRVSISGALREGSRGSGTGRGIGRLRVALVVVQAALAVVLLSGATLLLTTFANLRSVEVGYDAEGLLAATFPRAAPGLTEPEALALFQQRVEREITQLPGVRAAATTSVVPFLGQLNFPVMVEGRAGIGEPAVQIRAVSGAFFETVRTPVLRGRAFDDRDAPAGAATIVINEAFARHFFPGEDPVGQRLQLGALPDFRIPGFDDPAREIVGVVADTRVQSLRGEPPRMLYIPQAQVHPMIASMPAVLVRADRPAAVARALPAALQALDPRLPAPRVREMSELLGVSMASERFVGTLLTLFAGIALLLTAVGIFGVISYNTRRRVREIGVRMALGADPGRIRALITRQGVTPVLVGLAAGLAIALYTTGLLEDLLFEVAPNDPLALATVAVLLAAVAWVASYLPAYQATRVDPMRSLRQE
jgi:putative ABC transport system permease protein